MKLLLENPFRVLGLPPTATERQISKRADDLSMYIEMGKEKKYKNDFSFLSPLNRTIETVQRAVQQIELAEQKLMHSIFWFHSGNSVDELVFELLNEGNLTKATELWGKSITPIEISIKSISNVRNLALFQMHQSNAEYGINVNDFLEAAKLFIKAIGHESMLDYVSQVSGPTSRISLTDIQKYFADELQKLLFTKVTSASAKGLEGKFISIFDGIDENVVQHVRNKFTEEPIHRLEEAISECSNTREFDKGKAKASAEKLHKTAGKLLKKLESSITKNDMHYQFIADKVAKELLRCSTDFFNSGQEDSNIIRLLEQSATITKWAKSYAQSAKVNSDVNVDLQTIKKLKKQQECDPLSTELLEALQGLPDVEDISHIAPITAVIMQTREPLESLKKLDSSIYAEYSNLIAMIVLRYSIAYANKHGDCSKIINELNLIKHLKMSADTRKHFNSNYKILKENAKNSSNSSGGCYIATLVYGSYDAPEVLELRSFRDNTLARTTLGRFFIKAYYSISPFLVRILKKQYLIQRIIRNILNKFIKSLTQ